MTTQIYRQNIEVITVKNKAGTWFGEKIKLDGFTFDSKKEADVYNKFVKESGYKFEVHKSFQLHPVIDLVDGDLRIRSSIYTPDFVIYGDDDSIQHVIDVKNGYSSYVIDSAASLRFKLFALEYGLPVEVLVPRTHDFKIKVMGTTKKFDPIIKSDFSYTLSELVDEAYNK